VKTIAEIEAEQDAIAADKKVVMTAMNAAFEKGDMVEYANQMTNLYPIIKRQQQNTADAFENAGVTIAGANIKVAP